MPFFLFSFVPAQNVGIGTAVPAERLHVAGSIRSDALAGIGSRMVRADANGTLVIMPNGANGDVITQTAGGPVWQAPGGGGGNDWTTTGNAGTNPATNFAGTTDATDFVIRTNNTERARVTSAGRLGVGTTAPTDNVHIVGTNQTTLRIVDGNQAAGRVLMSTADGSAYWSRTRTSPVHVNECCAGTDYLVQSSWVNIWSDGNSTYSIHVQNTSGSTLKCVLFHQ